MLIIHKVSIDLLKPGAMQVVFAMQADENSRALEFSLFVNGKAWNIPEDVSFSVAYLKPDKTRGIYDTLPNGAPAATFSENVVSVKLAPQMLTAHGLVQASVVMTDSDMNRLNTFPVTVHVIANPSVGATESKDYYYLTAIAAIGDLNDLETNDKSSIVAAINEILAGSSGSGGSDSSQNVELDTTLSKSGKAADAKAVGDALRNLSVSGLTTAQINALDGMFKVCAFTKADISAEYGAFKTAFGLSNSGDSGDSGDDSGGETVTTYTVTNNLTNLTTDNTAVSIESGKLYTANLTAEDGYTIESVVVTMGGVEISAYGDGVISVDSVTGDIVITATATQMHTDAAIYTLAEATTFAGDGSDKINTGVDSLFDMAGEWAFVITSTVNSFGWSRQTLCFIDGRDPEVTQSNAYVEYALGAGGWYVIRNTGSSINANAVYSRDTQNAKTIIMHDAGSTGVTAYYLSDGAVTSLHVGSGTGSFNIKKHTVTLGNSFNGTISDFKLYQRKLTGTEINEYLGVA